MKTLKSGCSKLYLIVMMFGLVTTAFAEPTLDQIKKAANDLGVPVTELQQLVNKYSSNKSSGFTNVAASSAHIIADIKEAKFLEDGKQLKVGDFYRMDCLFELQSGTTVYLNPGFWGVVSNSLIRLTSGTRVSVLLKCVGNKGINDFELIEIIAR